MKKRCLFFVKFFVLSLLISSLALAEAPRKTTPEGENSDRARITIAQELLPPEAADSDLEFSFVFEDEASMHEYLNSEKPAGMTDVIRQTNFYAFLNSEKISKGHNFLEILNGFNSGQISRTICTNVVAVGMYASFYIEAAKQKPKEKTAETDAGCPIWWNVECPTDKECVYESAPSDYSMTKNHMGKCFRDPLELWLCLCSIYY